jgi:hypothetical protein
MNLHILSRACECDVSSIKGSLLAAHKKYLLEEAL